ncbi:MAG: Lrp/AsnC family transcriptional regulator [Alphaproteobacteria bacterium]
MQKVKLDSIDRKILSELQADGRITNVELAKRVDISAPPCLRRVRALEDAGLIQGYHARLDSRALGYHVTVFVLVALSHHADADLRQFEALVQSWDMVRECYMIQGDYDFLLKCVTPDLDAFQAFLTNDLSAAPHVEKTRTATVVRTKKMEPGVPVPENAGY